MRQQQVRPTTRTLGALPPQRTQLTPQRRIRTDHKIGHTHRRLRHIHKRDTSDYAWFRGYRREVSLQVWKVILLGSK
ncbi:hypothetical protein GCM10010402_38060 [Actinomadura luteofluorescens]